MELEELEKELHKMYDIHTYVKDQNLIKEFNKHRILKEIQISIEILERDICFELGRVELIKRRTKNG